jgi:hypothetical protein
MAFPPVPQRQRRSYREDPLGKLLVVSCRLCGMVLELIYLDTNLWNRL